MCQCRIIKQKFIIKLQSLEPHNYYWFFSFLYVSVANLQLSTQCLKFQQLIALHIPLKTQTFRTSCSSVVVASFWKSLALLNRCYLHNFMCFIKPNMTLYFAHNFWERLFHLFHFTIIFMNMKLIWIFKCFEWFTVLRWNCQIHWFTKQFLCYSRFK